MKRPLYTELESALCMAQNDSGNLHCALNDILNDQVTWFRRGDWRVGTCRENGPAGGLVIVRQLNNTNARGYASVYLWEDWFPQIRDNAPSHTDKEGINLRNAALEAHLHMMKCQMPETRTA